MTAAERLATDFAIQSSSTGPHPMKLWRETALLTSHSALGTSPKNLVHSGNILHLPHGLPIEIAGMVICRQRPGTAKGHCFISLEDEFGIANLFIPRKTFHQYRLTIVCRILPPRARSPPDHRRPQTHRLRHPPRPPPRRLGNPNHLPRLPLM